MDIKLTSPILGKNPGDVVVTGDDGMIYDAHWSFLENGGV